MNIRRVLCVTALALGITVVGVGESVTTPTPIPAVQVERASEQQPAIEANGNAKIVFPRSEVVTVAAPVQPEPEVADPEENVAVRKESSVPVNPVTVGNTPTPAIAPVISNTPAVQAPVNIAPVVEAAPAFDREVYVGLAGGQSVVDLGRGPVLFPLNGAFPPYVAEHDLDGGWARFGTLSAGMKVRMSGLVTGTYTVGQIINVPKGGSTDELRKFTVMPKVMLQTCVPGTTRMIIVGLY